MKNSDLLDAVASINAIAALKQPVRTSFVIALNLKAVRDHLEIFEGQRKKLVDQYTQRDDKGVAIPVYAPAVDKDGKAIVDPDGHLIMDADGKPPVDKDGKALRPLEGHFHLVDPAKFREDIKELTEIDVTKEVTIRPVKLSLLEGSIEPQHFCNVLWMINDDLAEVPAAPKPV